MPGPNILRRRVLMALCLLPLAGCASLPGQSGRAIDPELGWTEEVQRQLEQRAQARWEALIANDLDKAYEFLTPDYRSVFSVQQYKGRFGGAVTWKGARVQSTQYDGNHVASVSVAVEYEALVSLAGHMRSVREMPEKWLYSDGAWWYISK